MRRIGTALCLAALCAALQAQGAFEARLAQLGGVMDRFYRGEPLDVARERSNREIAAFNARTKALQAELDAARVRMDAVLNPAKEAYTQVQAQEKALKALPPGSDQDEMKKQVEARNALAKRYTELNAAAQPAVEAYNTQAKRNQEAVAKERERVLEEQKALDARVAAYEAFARGGQDLAFFTDLNRLLADVRQVLRGAPGQADAEAALGKVRALRRELAAWAIAAQGRQPNGLVVVEARLGDEPCWLIVDTGATNTVVGTELAEAVGLGSLPGEAASLTVVGGLRIQGRTVQAPRLEAAGQAQENVRVSMVRPSDVGIDGLLGQSFLKAFAYTVDERLPAKLTLVRR